MKKACFASLSLILSAVLMPARTVHAAPYGIYRLGFEANSLSFDSAPRVLRYYGGPVIARAKVYAVFWGRGVNPDIRSGIGPFYANILNSGYIDWLSEYDTDLAAVDGRPGTSQKIGRGRFMGSVTIAPLNQSSELTDGMIRRELGAQIAAGHLAAPDGDTLYMIYFPAGINISLPDESQSCQDFGAYHGGFKAQDGASVFYGVMPDCDYGFKDASVVSSHETIEAITDPFPTIGDNPAYPQAWNSDSGDEVADLCDGEPDSHVTGSGGLVSAVEPGFDDLINGCNMGPWTTAGEEAAKAPRVALQRVLHLGPAPAMPALTPLNPLFSWAGR